MLVGSLATCIDALERPTEAAVLAVLAQASINFSKIAGLEAYEKALERGLLNNQAGSENSDLRGLWAFSSLSRYVAYTLVFFQRFEAFALDFREVSKQIFATVLRHDKAEAFLRVEPLNNTGFHSTSFKSNARAIARTDDQGRTEDNDGTLIAHDRTTITTLEDPCHYGCLSARSQPTLHMSYQGRPKTLRRAMHTDFQR